jgi:hypothetical protein
MASDSDNPGTQGYEAGKSGESSESNPHGDDSVSGRMFDITTDVVTGNVGDRTQSQDKDASDWDAGHEAGSKDREE